MSDLIGQQLGQYEVVARIGAGGMATVYRARQAKIGREVAIKVIKGELADSADFARRFEREARTIAALSHPHILKLFDYGEQEGMVYLVMELLTGGSLADVIHRQGPLPFDTITRLVDQLGSALDYAHQQGVIHRDLKPQNVLLDQNGNALLTDFGIAKVMGDMTALTQTGTALGTPSYMAPEQWLGQPIDSRADIYSLGVMLFEMLTGRTPYVSETPFGLMHQHVYEPPPAASSLRDGLPAAVQPVLEQALAKDRDQRFASAQALASAFKAAVAEPAAPTSVLVSDDEPTERVPIAIEKRAAADPPAQRTVVDIPAGTSTAGTPSRGRIGLPLLAALAAVAVISLVIAVLSSRGPGNNPPVTQLLATGALAGPVWTMTPTPPTATLPGIVNPNPALPTTTPLPPTLTPLPSDTNTPVPTATPLPLTLTPLPSDTNTPVPSDTPEASTLTPLPSDTPILTDTPEALTLTQSPLATGTVTLPFHEPIDTDIAAFCDQIGGAHPTFKTGTSIAVYWSWDAKTARLTQDHINNAFYTVQVDGQTLTGWEHRRTDIIQQADGHYYVYWFMPPLTGDLIAKGKHQIALKVTWKAPISDGDYNFGPGTSNEVGTGSCGYTIN